MKNSKPQTPQLGAGICGIAFPQLGAADTFPRLLERNPQELQAVKDNPKLPQLEAGQEELKTQLRDFSNETFDKLKRLAEQDCYLESKIEQLNNDMDTVLQVGSLCS